MRKIALTVYQDLSPRQRIVACIEAEARGDEDEKRRLISSCPKVTYSSTDARFSDAMEKLFALAMAVEADLKECVIGFLIAARIDPKNSRRFLQDFADIKDSWKSTLFGMGISEESMVLAGPPSSTYFELFEDIIPKPNRANSAKLANEMLKIINPK